MRKSWPLFGKQKFGLDQSTVKQIQLIFCLRFVPLCLFSPLSSVLWARNRYQQTISKDVLIPKIYLEQRGARREVARCRSQEDPPGIPSHKSFQYIWMFYVSVTLLIKLKVHRDFVKKNKFSANFINTTVYDIGLKYSNKDDTAVSRISWLKMKAQKYSFILLNVTFTLSTYVYFHFLCTHLWQEEVRSLA